MVDESLQKAIFYLTAPGGVKWNDFPPVGVNDHRHVWYYAEDQTYVIKDVLANAFYFEKAGSPRQAYEQMIEKQRPVIAAGIVWKEEKEN